MRPPTACARAALHEKRDRRRGVRAAPRAGGLVEDVVGAVRVEVPDVRHLEKADLAFFGLDAVPGNLADEPLPHRVTSPAIS